MKRRPDHDPATLDAHARRLETHALIDGTSATRANELLATADLLRRLAEDLRLLNRFLKDAGLLATEDDAECHAPT